ncbi:hypothetical protein [Nitrospira sp. Kam-Ns4a]
MAWGILFTALTLFGMLVLTVAALLLDSAAADQKPVRLIEPDPGASAARSASAVGPAADPSASKKAA